MTDQELENAKNQGVAAHRAGRPDEALGFYRQALDLAPQDPDAQALCGLALVHVGRPAEAEPLIRAAIEQVPDEPGYRTNLADYYRAIGDENAALAEIENIISMNPSLPFVWERKGDIHFQRNEPEAAARAYDQSLQLYGDNYDLTVKLVQALCGIQQFDSALQTLDHAERIKPGEIQIKDLRCEVLTLKADWLGLLKSCEDRTRADETDAAAWRYMASGLMEIGRYRDARIAFENALKHDSRTPNALTRYARLCIQSLEFDLAEKALAEAEEAAPNLPAVLSAKALLLTYQGKTKEAEDYCLRCIAVDPGYMDVYPQLSLLRKGALTEAEAAPLAEIARREDIRLPHRANASFVLADAYDARKEYEKAFREYEYANGLGVQRNARENYAFSPEKLQGWTAHLIKTFDSPRPKLPAPKNPPPAQPIFVVGLPRCGSTLIESVLAAHSKVAAGGEQPMMPTIFINWLNAQGIDGDGTLSEEDRDKFLETYFAQATPANGADYLTDKNLLNIESTGLITQLFPDAKIINVRRNPLECGLSIFTHQLPKFWNYANSLADIGARFGANARLTEHFEKAYPDQFMTIQYEDFTRDFDKGARALIDACGLDWEDACADFQSADRVAATLSAVQVREEVEMKSGRAEAYAAYLGPLREALTAANVDLTTGALTSA